MEKKILELVNSSTAENFEEFKDSLPSPLKETINLQETIINEN